MGRTYAACPLANSQYISQRLAAETLTPFTVVTILRAQGVFLDRVVERVRLGRWSGEAWKRDGRLRPSSESSAGHYDLTSVTALGFGAAGFFGAATFLVAGGS